MSDCLFCRIIENKIPAQRVYEDCSTIVIRDINPQAPNHFLAIPKKHYAAIHQIPQSEMSNITSLFSAVREVIKSESLDDTKGYRLVINYGEHAGQSVHHIHVHILSGREMKWPPG